MLVWRAGEKRACQKIRIASDFELSLLASRESLTIDQVELFSILEPSAIYDRDGKPGAQLAAIRKLNTLVAIDFQPGKAVAHELARTEK